MDYSFNGLDIDHFLSSYWQKHPLVVLKAFNLDGLVDGNELAGLAMEPDVEARLITTNEDLTTWHVTHGPFNEDVFQTLPESHWTLLVQAVDHWLPDVRELLTAFHFLPQWRTDDIMISFATAGGGVGPHFDQYDVFLIQLSGQREWKIGQQCDENTKMVKDVPVKLLADFQEADRWLMQPGDVLYIPPSVAHWGTAVTDSITISVGFRAPASSEVVAELGHFLSTRLPDFQRYSDSNIENRSQSPHEILKTDISRLKSLLLDVVKDEESIGQWFGQYMTEPKYSENEITKTNLTVSEFLNNWQEEPIYRNTASRLAFINGTLFADGHAFPTTVPSKDLHRLCDNDELDFGLFTDLSTELAELILSLFNEGVFFFDG